MFVGDRPSKKNLNPDIPFVGTKSYKTLLNWIADMNINIADVELRNVSDIGLKWQPWSCHSYKYVALGKISARILSTWNCQHYKLPHPSGLNIKINNKIWLKQELKRCESWIKEQNESIV